MRVFWIAFLAFIASAALALSLVAPAYALPSDWQAAAALLLLVLSLVLQGEGVNAMKQSARLARLSEEHQQLTHKYSALVAQPQPAPQPQPTPLLPAPVSQEGEEALQLLALLQEKGRLIDFVMEDVAPYADAQIGAAARLVHKGCAEVLRDHFAISALTSQQEGQEITVNAGYSPQAYRLLGSQTKPPYHGTVVHPGWRTEKIALPRLLDPTSRRFDGYQVISPIEVELTSNTQGQ